MPIFQPGQSLPHLELTLKTPICDEAWGEAWRATHEKHGAVIFAAYCGAQGEKHFNQTLPRFARWNEIAGQTPGLAKIIEEHTESAVPYRLIEDPGGATHREIGRRGRLDPRTAAQFGLEVCRALSALAGEKVQPIGLNPDRLIVTGTPPTQWKILPLALTAVDNLGATGSQPWLPADLASADDPMRANADTYSLSLLMGASLLGAPDNPPQRTTFRSAIPFPRLATILGNNVTPRAGSYTDPRTCIMALERYIKVEAKEDQAEFDEKLRAAKRTPFQQAMVTYRPQLMLAARALAVVAGVIVLVFGCFAMFTSSNARGSPRGTARVYFEALVARNATEADKMTSGEAAGQSQRLLNDILRMEQAHETSRLAQATPPRMGDAQSSNVQATTTLMGESGDSFMRVDFVLEHKKSPKDQWEIVRLLWAPITPPPPTEPAK